MTTEVSYYMVFLLTSIHGVDKLMYSAGIGSAYGSLVVSVSCWGEGTRVLGGASGGSVVLESSLYVKFKQNFIWNKNTLWQQ